MGVHGLKLNYSNFTNRPEKPPPVEAITNVWSMVGGKIEESVWGRFGVGLGSVWGRFGILSVIDRLSLSIIYRLQCLLY